MSFLLFAGLQIIGAVLQVHTATLAYEHMKLTPLEHTQISPLHGLQGVKDGVCQSWTGLIRSLGVLSWCNWHCMYTRFGTESKWPRQIRQRLDV